MQGVGYNASEQDSLPVLFKDVFGFELKKCQDCWEKAKKSLNNWAQRASKQTTQYMAYSIKPEYHKKDFVFRHAGKVVVVNSQNLNEERAMWMLASPYAHAIVGQRDKTPEELYEGDVQEAKKATEFTKVKSETSKIEEIPNESEVVTASTSTEAKADGKQSVFAVKGKLSPTPELQPKKRGRPFKQEKSPVG